MPVCLLDGPGWCGMRAGRNGRFTISPTVVANICTIGRLARKRLSSICWPLLMAKRIRRRHNVNLLEWRGQQCPQEITVTCGVYQILNNENGKKYIGSSSNIEGR